MMGERDEPKSKPLRLSFWSEFVDIYKGLHKDQNYTYIKMNEGLLSFRNKSKEITHIQEKLNNTTIGTEIAILRTDIPGKPLFIRLVRSKQDIGNYPNNEVVS